MKLLTLKDTFANRLSKAMLIKNIKQIELSKRTGIDRSCLNHYLQGHYKAKQDNLYKLAKALNVSEAYLMGLDVNPDGSIIEKTIEEEDPLVDMLIGNIKLLNNEDKNLIRYIIQTRINESK